MRLARKSLWVASLVAWAVAGAVAAVSIACRFSFQSPVHTLLLVGLSEQLQRFGSTTLLKFRNQWHRPIRNKVVLRMVPSDNFIDIPRLRPTLQWVGKGDRWKSRPLAYAQLTRSLRGAYAKSPLGSGFPTREVGSPFLVRKRTLHSPEEHFSTAMFEKLLQGLTCNAFWKQWFMQGQASLRELTRSGLYDFAQKSLRELTRATRFAYAVSYMLAHVKIPLPGKKTLLKCGFPKESLWKSICLAQC